MKLVHSNEVVPRRMVDTKTSFLFGGFNPSIEIDSIAKVEPLYFYPKNKDLPAVPVVMVTLKDGTHIAIHFNTIEEVKEACRQYRLQCTLEVVDKENK